MSAEGKRFALITAVIVAIVFGAWYWNRRRKAAASTSKFAKLPDGSPDYTKQADGTPIRFT